MTEPLDFDFLVVGAGFGGLNAVYKLRQAGYSVRGFDSAAGLGGTWYWNGYPGARVDVESVEYSYGFSDEVQQGWRWPYRYSSRDDVLRYLNWVADKLDLRKDFDFSVSVARAEYDEHGHAWLVTLGDGRTRRARYLVMATGTLAAPYLPDIPGISDFAGQLVHSALWPQNGVELAGKRVAVVGTGASALQIIPAIAPEVESLVVFQRTPNWAIPIRNGPINAAYERYVKGNYSEIRRCEYDEGRGGMILVGGRMMRPDPRSALSVSDDERAALYEARWRDGGSHYAFLFGDLLSNQSANDTLREFLAGKVRQIVEDPEVARLLIPKHPPLSRRLCGVTGYYETYKRDNVRLIDITETPITTITTAGALLETGECLDFDVLILATGFDGGTGALTRIDIVGRDGQVLRDKWSKRLTTHLGIMTRDFPNLFLVNGPHSPGVFFSPPLLVDFQSSLVCDLVDQLRAAGATEIEPSPEAEERYSSHVDNLVEGTLLPQSDSWWMGANVPGKPRQIVAFTGGFPMYRDLCVRASDALAEYVVTA